MFTGTFSVVANADLLSNKSRLTNSTWQSKCALWQEEREQLKTRARLKYSFDFFFENQVLGAVFFVVVVVLRQQFCSQNAGNWNRIITTQGKILECQVCYVDSV